MYGPATGGSHSRRPPGGPRRRPLPLPTPTPSSASTVTAFEVFSNRSPSQLSQSPFGFVWTDNEDDYQRGERLVPGKPAPILSPLPLNFDYPPVQWSGLRLRDAQYALTSAQLQSLVSRAIRTCSEDVIRLLIPQVLDKEIPAEIVRLDALKTTTQAQFRFLSNRRTNLLRSLHVASVSPTPSELHALPALTSQLAEVSSGLDSLTIELLHIADQRAQIDRLINVHNASALSIALRKLNASVSKRAGEIEQMRAKVAAMAEDLRAREESESDWLFSVSDSGETLDTEPPTPRSGRPDSGGPFVARPPPPRPLMLPKRVTAPPAPSSLPSTSTPIQSPGPPAYEKVSGQLDRMKPEKSNTPTPTTSPPRPALTNPPHDPVAPTRVKTPPKTISIPTSLPPLAIPVDHRRASLTRPSPLSVSPASAVSYIEADAEGQVVVLITGRAIAAQPTYSHTPPFNASSGSLPHVLRSSTMDSTSSSSDYHSGGSSTASSATFDTPPTTASSSSGSSTQTLHAKLSDTVPTSSPLRKEVEVEAAERHENTSSRAQPPITRKLRPQNLQALRVPPVRMPGGKIMIHQGSRTPSPATGLASASANGQLSSRSHIALIDRALLSAADLLSKASSVVVSTSEEDSGSSYSSSGTPSSSSSTSGGRTSSSDSSAEFVDSSVPSASLLNTIDEEPSSAGYPHIEVFSPHHFADDEDDEAGDAYRRQSLGEMGVFPPQDNDRLSLTMRDGEVSAFAENYMSPGLPTGVSSFADHYLSAYPPPTGTSAFSFSQKTSDMNGPSTADIYGFYDVPGVDDNAMSPVSALPQERSSIASYYYAQSPLPSPAHRPHHSSVLSSHMPHSTTSNAFSEIGETGAQHYPPEPVEARGPEDSVLRTAPLKLKVKSPVTSPAGNVVCALPTPIHSYAQKTALELELDAEVMFGDKVSQLIIATDAANRLRESQLMEIEHKFRAELTEVPDPALVPLPSPDKDLAGVGLL